MIDAMERTVAPSLHWATVVGRSLAVGLYLTLVNMLS
jgi:hypothetical protein